MLDQDRVVAAAMDPLELTVVKDGDGSITSVPPGLECGAGCGSASASYPSGTVVRLRATPATAALTVTWSGRCRRVKDGVCTVRVVDDTRLKAVFHLPVPGPPGGGGAEFTVPITVVKAGPGPGVIVVARPRGGGRGIRCPTICRASGYGLSDRMRIAALPEPGGVFVRWRNGCRPATRRRCLVDALTHTSMRGTFSRLLQRVRP